MNVHATPHPDNAHTQVSGSQDGSSHTPHLRATMRARSLWLTILLLASTSLADTSHRNEAKHQLAVRAAAREILDHLAEVVDTSAADATLLAEDLKSLMLRSVPQHKTEELSRAQAMQRMKERRESKVMELMDAALARANELSPVPSTREDLVARLGPGWPQQKDAAVKKFIDSHFDQIFKTARSSAVMAQKAHIEQSVQYPHFDELDTRLMELAPTPDKAHTPLNKKSFAPLQSWIQSLTYADSEPFEENLPTIKKLGDDVLAEITAQYDKQIAFISDQLKTDAVPPDCVSRVTIEEALTSALTEWTHSTTPNSRVPTYAPFTAVKNHVAWQASELEKKRLLAFIARPDSVQIQRAAIDKQLTENPAAHHTAAQSQKLLLDLYIEQIHRPLAEKYAARSKTPVVNQIDVLLLDDGAVSKALRGRVDGAIKEHLAPARAAFAKQQFETIFPALDKGTPFTEQMIEFLHDRQIPTLTKTSHLTDMLNLDPDLAPKQHNPADLLAETETRAREAANTQAVPLVSALGAQLRLLAEIEKGGTEQLRADVEAGKPFEEIRQAWEKKLEERWKKESGEVPERARALFKRTRSQSDKAVRQLYDALKAEEAAAEKAKEMTAIDAEQTASPESGSVEVPEEKEEKEEEEEVEPEDDLAGLEEEILTYQGSADFLLIVADAAEGNCRALFGRPGTGMVAGTDFPPSEIESAADAIAQALHDEFTTLLRDKRKSARSPGIFFWRKRTPRVRVLVLERSRQARHITSILLQRRIRDQIQDYTKADKTKFGLDWQESLGTEED